MDQHHLYPRMRSPLPCSSLTGPRAVEAMGASAPLLCLCETQHHRLPLAAKRSLLLRPHSPTTAFHSRLLPLPPCRPLQGTGYQTGSHSGSRVSSGLPLIAHVASRCYSADLVVVCPRLPPGHSFRHDSRAHFSRQNTEAPAYPPTKGVHGSAPSSMRVTCKGFRPFHG